MNPHNDPAEPAADARAFGRRLAEARRDAGITQADIARRTGVTVRAVQYWEAGHALPALKLARIAAVVGRSPGWLRTGAGDDELRRRVAANHRRTEQLIQALERTASRSGDLLGMLNTAGDEAETLNRVALWRGLADRWRMRAGHAEQNVARLEADGEPERAAFDRERAAIYRALADHDERRAAYEERRAAAAADGGPRWGQTPNGSATEVQRPPFGV